MMETTDEAKPLLLDDNYDSESSKRNAEAKHDEAVGGKNIGTYGSFVYIINQIFGPGVLAIPIVFQQAGWVVTVITMVFFMFLSGWSATLLIQTMRMVPGNANFEKRIEYATLVKYYFGKKVYVLFQIALNICLQSLNIASIIVVAQSMDSLLVFLFNKSFCLEFYPHFRFDAGGFDAINLWYSDQVFTITLGYIIVMGLCIPMGVINLDENIKFQWVSFAGLVVLMAEFTFFFLFESPFYFDQVPAFGTEYKQVASVFIFSWAFIMLVPSWANEKKDHVSVNRTIWISAIVSNLGYLSVGFLGAVSFQHLISDDILKRMSGAGVFILTRICAYLFSLLIISPGIPVYCITTRYNLYVGGVCSKRWAHFWGVIAPWLVGFIFTQGPIFADLLNWTALLFSGVVNFILPFLLYMKACREQFRVETINSTSDLQAPGMKDLIEELDTEPPFPKFLRPHAMKVIYTLLVLITLVIIAQIVLDLYYLFALGQNLV